MSELKSAWGGVNESQGGGDVSSQHLGRSQQGIFFFQPMGPLSFFLPPFDEGNQSGNELVRSRPHHPGDAAAPRSSPGPYSDALITLFLDAPVQGSPKQTNLIISLENSVVLYSSSHKSITSKKSRTQKLTNSRPLPHKFFSTSNP